MGFEIPGAAQGALVFIALKVIEYAAPAVIQRFTKRAEERDKTDAAIAVKQFENGTTQRQELQAELKEARKDIRQLERDYLALMKDKDRAELKCSQLEERIQVLEAHHKNCDHRV
jgi:septal ring factor EnvC (AmiA/AmiB activator)